MVKEAQKLARLEDKKKQREALMAERANGGDVDSLASSTVYSEKSGSKKAGKMTNDQKSSQSPHN